VNDLDKLRSVFSKQTSSPWSDWPIAREGDDPPGTDHILVIGCPDGTSSYLSCLFDSRGNLLSAQVIDRLGDTCPCKYCAPKPKKRRKK
jgi:hypothetical protein